MTTKKNTFDAYEIDYLNNAIKYINERIGIISDYLADSHKELMDYKKYVWDNIYEMDAIEKASNADMIIGEEGNIERNIQELNTLKRLVKSPYFGRIDFSYDDDSADMAEKFYIGIYGFTPQDEYEQLIYDWRAPISSMFYDCDEGPASYKAPNKIFNGIIRKKRQYKIENGKFVFILDSSLKIDDEILQETLSHSSDNKMKNIVSTIQREQNQIIRNMDAQKLIIQGVAGSGKTSIALHRIAYILYNFRNTIKSNEILVVSPNKVFSDYISNVLPELGETNINEMSFDDLLNAELRNICKIENRFDFLENLIQIGDEKTEHKASIEYKSSIDFYNNMIKFFNTFVERYLNFVDVEIDDINISGEYIKENYLKTYSKKIPYFNRFENIVNLFSDHIEVTKGKVIGTRLRNKILNKLKSICLRKNNILDIYNDFLIEQSKLTGINLTGINKEKLNYEDAFPLVYFKFELLGYSTFDKIKHVVIDEMQDYSFIQFEILKNIFKCNMTLLGDINQVITRQDTNVLNILNKIFENSQIIKINKTYRSTAEITNFANKIIELKDIVVFDRHGKKPQLKKCKNIEEEIEKIKSTLQDLRNKGLTNIAIICKTEEEAKFIHQSLNIKEILLFTKTSSKFSGGIIVITSYIAKGLEFDAVIIPEVNENNYSSSIDQQILYIACTRALHELYLFYAGKMTNFLNFDK